MFAKNNRGQITLFIIIGLILLLAITLYLIFRNETTPILTGNEITKNLDFVEVQEHMQYCLRTVSEDAIVINGLKGGLYDPEKYVLGAARPQTTTFYEKGNVVAPTGEEVAYSIGQEFLDLMPSCLEDFNGSTENISFNAENAEITVTIVTDYISFRGEYPVTSIKTDESFTFSQFNYDIKDIRVATALDLATELSYIQQQDPEYICVTCTVEMADQNYFYIDFSNLDNRTTVYTFTDLFSSINGEPYYFVMAHEH